MRYARRPRNCCSAGESLDLKSSELLKPHSTACRFIQPCSSPCRSPAMLCEYQCSTVIFIGSLTDTSSYGARS